MPRSEVCVSDPKGSALIDELIANTNFSHDEIAIKLAEIALNSKTSENERIKALRHCEDLGFSQLLPLSNDPHLPYSLSEAFIDGLYRHDSIKEKVSGALGLLNHFDSEIRERAQSLLGSLLSREEEIKSPDNLRAAADAFLQQFDEFDPGP